MGTKDTVLELFEKNRGFFISGERIAEELSVSRTAVWKAVKKLQKDMLYIHFLHLLTILNYVLKKHIIVSKLF